MISHKYKIVFVHISKNAGNSIVNNYFNEIDNLSELAPSPTYTNIHAGLCKGLLNGGLKSASKRHGYLNKCDWLMNIWNSYKKFAVVRNPYDRFISGLKHADKQHGGGLSFDSDDNLKEDTYSKIMKIKYLYLPIKYLPKAQILLPKFYQWYPHWHKHICEPQTPMILKEAF